MISAIVTFLGGAAARLFIGYVYELVSKHLENKNELARMKAQAEIEAAAHTRALEVMREQAALGVRLINVQAERDRLAAEDNMLIAGIQAAARPTGIAWVDAWNGVIRPLLASMCIVLWAASIWQRSGVLDDWDRSLMSMALGVFVGGRIQATRR